MKMYQRATENGDILNYEKASYGENLLQDSLKLNNLAGYDGSTLEVSEDGVVMTNAGNQTVKLKAYNTFNENIIPNVRNGETYTISLLIENLREFELSIRANGLNNYSQVTIPANSRKVVSITGTRNSEYYLQLQMLAHNEKYYVKFKVHYFKIEKGTTATPWTPAIADLSTTEEKVDHLLKLYYGGY